MKHVFAAIFLNFISIGIFSIIYIYLTDDFIYNVSAKNDKIQIIDLIMYASTIQSGVGITNIMPITFKSKFYTILQQYLMISFNLLILYFFVLL
jgi:hypothetical protein